MKAAWTGGEKEGKHGQSTDCPPGINGLNIKGKRDTMQKLTIWTAGGAIVISDKVDFKTKNIRRNNEINKFHNDKGVNYFFKN